MAFMFIKAKQLHVQCVLLGIGTLEEVRRKG